MVLLSLARARLHMMVHGVEYDTVELAELWDLSKNATHQQLHRMRRDGLVVTRRPATPRYGVHTVHVRVSPAGPDLEAYRKEAMRAAMGPPSTERRLAIMLLRVIDYVRSSEGSP